MDTPVKLIRMLNHDKRQKLNELLNICLKESDNHKKAYYSLKKLDERIEIATSTMSASSLAFVISGFVNPILMIGSAVFSGLTFIITTIHQKSKLKYKIERHDASSKEYNILSRHIGSVLLKNNLSSAEYQNFIFEINMQLNLIEGNAL